MGDLSERDLAELAELEAALAELEALDEAELTDEQVAAQLAEFEAQIDKEEKGKDGAGSPAKTKLDKQLKKLRREQDEVTAAQGEVTAALRSFDTYTKAEKKELERELADLLKEGDRGGGGRTRKARRRRKTRKGGKRKRVRKRSCVRHLKNPSNYKIRGNKVFIRTKGRNGNVYWKPTFITRGDILRGKRSKRKRRTVRRRRRR